MHAHLHRALHEDQNEHLPPLCPVSCGHTSSHRYDQLSSSMVDRGDWGVGDDKRMLLALRDGGYEVEWEVPWGSLVEGRSEQVRTCGGGACSSACASVCFVLYKHACMTVSPCSVCSQFASLGQVAAHFLIVHFFARSMASWEPQLPLKALSTSIIWQGYIHAPCPRAAELLPQVGQCNFLLINYRLAETKVIFVLLCLWGSSRKEDNLASCEATHAGEVSEVQMVGRHTGCVHSST
eukprot:scaffold77220_cov24-Tisochrysis_lutea.AAC.1